MRFFVLSLVMFSVCQYSIAGWFGPSTVSECKDEHKDDVVYLKAISSVNRACWVLYSGNKEIRSNFSNTISNESIDEYKDAAKCYLKKSASKKLVSKESAANAAADCTDSRSAFRFLTWSYSK
jgi:hypothetical protein